MWTMDDMARHASRPAPCLQCSTHWSGVPESHPFHLYADPNKTTALHMYTLKSTLTRHKGHEPSTVPFNMNIHPGHSEAIYPAMQFLHLNTNHTAFQVLIYECC